MARFISGSCQGEVCHFENCGDAASHKIEETIFHDDPIQLRHPLTSYICHKHFRDLMGPAADR